MATFREVPPPAVAPEDIVASAFGLPRGLRFEPNYGQFRCNQCRRLTSGNEGIVWVPDFVRITDSAEAVTEAARRGAFNGEASGWCLPCAQRLGRSTVPATVSSWMGKLSEWLTK